MRSLVPLELKILLNFRIWPDRGLDDWHILAACKFFLSDLISFLLFLELLRCQRSLRLSLSRWVWLAHEPVRLLCIQLGALWAFRFAFVDDLCWLQHCVSVDLPELWLVGAAMRVDIVRLHVLTVR